jgi:hypothetical protein
MSAIKEFQYRSVMRSECGRALEGRARRVWLQNIRAARFASALISKISSYVLFSFVLIRPRRECTSVLSELCVVLRYSLAVSESLTLHCCGSACFSRSPLRMAHHPHLDIFPSEFEIAFITSLLCLHDNHLCPFVPDVSFRTQSGRPAHTSP